MKKILIDGMMCQHCVKSVTKALTNLGASNIEVNLDGYAIVDTNKSNDELKKTIEDLDFKVVDIIEI